MRRRPAVSLRPVHGPPGFHGAFRTDEEARALYAEGAGVYRILPAAVAAPLDLDDLVSLVRWARASGQALVPRGAGSGMPGHNVGAGIVLDLRRGFREAAAVDAGSRTARAGAATTYRELNGAALAHGLRLPPDPSSGAFCTLGGMVGTNAAGAHSLRHGAMRRWVRALEFVTADGEVGRALPHGRTAAREGGGTAAEQRFLRDIAPAIEASQGELEARRPKARKNASGYDLLPPDDGGWVKNLLVGSEGTLAIVTAVEVGLATLPREVATLLVALGDLADLAPALDKLDAFEPEAVELLDRTFLDFVRAAAHASVPADTAAVLLVELEGDGRDAEAALHGFAARVVRADEPGAAGKLWETRHLASPILAGLPDHVRSLQIIEDGCVPRPRLGTYVAGLRRIARAHGFDVVIFGHAGDGHVHANVLADAGDPGLVARLLACLDEVTRLQIALGGTPSGEHGDGRLRAPYLPALLGERYADLARSVKRAFDPDGILNPGVKIAAGPALEAGNLKVGPAAPRVPRDVAEALRRIEKEAGYGLDRLSLVPAATPAGV